MRGNAYFDIDFLYLASCSQVASKRHELWVSGATVLLY